MKREKETKRKTKSGASKKKMRSRGGERGYRSERNVEWGWPKWGGEVFLEILKRHYSNA